MKIDRQKKKKCVNIRIKISVKTVKVKDVPKTKTQNLYILKFSVLSFIVEF